MLRVLTLSTLFPNRAQPTLGVFIERQTLGLAALQGVEVEVVSPVGLPPPPLSRHPHYAARARLPLSEEWKGLAVHRPRYRVFPGFGQARAARSAARSALPLLRSIRERFPFDVIDAEFFWPDGPAAMHLGRALGVPFSVTARGSDIQYWMHRKGVAGQIVESAHAAGGMLAVSAALGRVMAGFGMPEDRIRVHYTGVDREMFRPLDRPSAKAGFGVSGPLVVTVGSLIPGKRQHLAIEAVERIAGATLLLVGEGPDRRSLQAMIARKGLSDRARLLGGLPQEEVGRLIAAADVMLLPSRSEGLANVWVEALAAGTPVVTCDVGGAREVIDRPEAGALVAPDAESIATAIRAILAHPPAQAAVRAASDRFSCEANVRALRQHLAAVAAAGALSRAA